jgi:hypothetical protein
MLKLLFVVLFWTIINKDEYMNSDLLFMYQFSHHYILLEKNIEYTYNFQHIFYLKYWEANKKNERFTAFSSLNNKLI